jgi:hypothetical protein
MADKLINELDGLTASNLLRVPVQGPNLNDETGSVNLNDIKNFILSDSGSNYIPVTHAQLVTLISASELIEGAFYQITDFETIWLQPITNIVYAATDTGGAIEPLVVLATSTNTLSREAWSTVFPTDKIEYDVTVDTLPGPINTKGKIVRRQDRVGNDIPFDFRTVKFRRVETSPGSGKYYNFSGAGDAIETYCFFYYNPADPFEYESYIVNNKIGPRSISGNIWSVNIVFFTTIQGAWNNTIGPDSSNTTLDDVEDLIIGRNSFNNIIEKAYKVSLVECGNNTIRDIQFTTIGEFRNNIQTTSRISYTNLIFLIGCNISGQFINVTGIGIVNTIIVNFRNNVLLTACNLFDLSAATHVQDFYSCEILDRVGGGSGGSALRYIDNAGATVITSPTV